MRIGKRIAAAGAALALACGPWLSACSGDDGAGAGAPAAVEAEEGAFPVTIAHAFGETTIEEAPARVVALGESDVDPLLALGVTPVLVRAWTSDGPLEWQRPLVGEPAPEWVEMEEVDAEEIAAAEPDLILALYSGLDQETYDKLSRIAPTVTYRDGGGDYQQSWEDSTADAGAAVGRPDAARGIIDEVDARIAALREAHPEWAGKTAAVAYGQGDELAAYATRDPRSRLLSALGFTVPEVLDEHADGGFAATFSRERADLLDLDVVIWADEEDCTMAGLKADPVLGELPVVAEDRSFCIIEELGEDQLQALWWQTALSIPYQLDALEGPLARIAGE